MGTDTMRLRSIRSLRTVSSFSSDHRSSLEGDFCVVPSSLIMMLFSFCNCRRVFATLVHATFAFSERVRDGYILIGWFSRFWR